jgi:hypothetical protein
MENQTNYMEKFLAQNEQTKLEVTYTPDLKQYKAREHYRNKRNNAYLLLVICALLNVGNAIATIADNLSLALMEFLIAAIILCLPLIMYAALRPSKFDEESYKFFEEYFAKVGTDTLEVFPYDNIYNVVDGKEYFFISSHGLNTVAVRKSAFSEDNGENLGKFLKEKVGDKYTVKK